MVSVPTIYFVFPYRGVGGVPVLFYRVAKYLTVNKLAHTLLVDFKDGAMANLARSSEVELPFAYYSEESELTIPENAYVIFQSMTPWSIFPKLIIHPNTRILFWNCHPYNLVLFIPILRIITYRFKKISRFVGSTFLRSWYLMLQSFIEIIHQKQGLVFMDQENIRNTEAYNDFVFKKTSFLPIPVELEIKEISPILKNEMQGLRFTWIGRIVDFKFYPLKRILLSMNSYASQRSLKYDFTIIGTGPYLKKLEHLATKLNYVNVSFLGDMELTDVRSYIENHTDIVVAMGTSALEGGALKRPTILLDLSYKNIPENYRFNWLYQTTGYNLAEEVTKKQLVATGNTFNSLISEYNENPILLANRCFDYVLDNHSLDVVSEKFLELLLASKLKGSDIQKINTQFNISIGNIIYRILRTKRLK